MQCHLHSHRPHHTPCHAPRASNSLCKLGSAVAALFTLRYLPRTIVSRPIRNRLFHEHFKSSTVPVAGSQRDPFINFSFSSASTVFFVVGRCLMQMPMPIFQMSSQTFVFAVCDLSAFACGRVPTQFQALGTAGMNVEPLTKFAPVGIYAHNSEQHSQPFRVIRRMCFGGIGHMCGWQP